MKESIFVYIYGYLPGQKYGGPVTSIYNFTEHFGDRYDIRIVCSNHDHGDAKAYTNIDAGWNNVGKAQVMYLPESEYSTERFKNLMQGLHVRMIYLTGVFSYVLNHAAITAARALQIKIVIATRGELCVNALAIKSWKKRPYLAIMRMIHEYKDCYFQVTSKEEWDQAQTCLTIPRDHIIYLQNLHGRVVEKDRAAKVSGLANIVFVSRISPKKNLLDAIKAAVNVRGELHFDIYGPIEDPAYWKECQKIIETVPHNVAIRYCGQLDMMGAREIYANYDSFVFPTLTENYGHVIVESLNADCPIIISRGTTPWDDADGKAGYVVDLHDISALTGAIERIIDMDEDHFRGLQESLREYREQHLHLQELLGGYNAMIEQS